MLQLFRLDDPLDAKQLACLILKTLKQHGIDSENVIGFMHDNVQLNLTAIDILREINCTEAANIGCFSHSADGSGKRFKTPELDLFLSTFIELFRVGEKAHNMWTKSTKCRRFQKPNKTRWWTRWEAAEFLRKNLHRVVTFLTTKHPGGWEPKSFVALRDMHRDKDFWATLMLQLAAVSDVGKPLVSATYRLEGNKLIILDAYDIIHSLELRMRSNSFPIVARLVETWKEHGHRM